MLHFGEEGISEFIMEEEAWETPTGTIRKKGYGPPKPIYLKVGDKITMGIEKLGEHSYTCIKKS